MNKKDDYIFLIHPGINNSCQNHWQSIWEKQNPVLYTRVEQTNWAFPQKKDWVENLDKAITNINSGLFIIAHSLGCINLAHWASKKFSNKILGALLVAPPDVETTDNPYLKRFAPVPKIKFCFPSILVASEDDIYSSIKNSEALANTWGSKFYNVGRKGHINAQSGINEWVEGKEILNSLVEWANTEAV